MDLLAVALMAVAVQALKPEDIPQEIAPYAKIIGGLCLAAGLLLGECPTMKRDLVCIARCCFGMVWI